MISVTLDLTCSVCGFSRFLLPIHQLDDANVCCANCAAYTCKALDLERVLSAVQHKPQTPQPSL
ncbi:hypothetical protein [Halomonas huangheensis]|uniref:Uncharacterized protein n=1 Tax=Halomonas huangheensis TaxID=1178482 RepID=W1N9A1_9GAMM|nr:hypothetical protein [Halomonas huangheensis]ALM53966.1 hypothetical protein AR456_18085 [Halomonas huangheensis]ERL52074.1 hypothetical protein BJB45_08915 [Halomonas huangheensis]